MTDNEVDPTPPSVVPPGRAKIWTVRLAILAIMFAGVFAFGEITLRLVLGTKPWAVYPRDVAIEPGGRFFQRDPMLGYVHLPGTYTMTMESGYEWTATHGDNTLRITHPPRTENGTTGARKPLWIFGCSLTHGWSVQDDETYPWLIQAKLPAWKVVNFGVGGYGTVHSLIQFRSALEAGDAPRLVVIAYADLHDDRNVFARRRRKAMVPWNKLGAIDVPRALLDDQGQLQIEMVPAEYAEFPLMRYSALMHQLEMAYNDFETLPSAAQQVSRAIVAEFDALCKDREIPLVIAILRKPTPMIEWCEEQGIPVADITYPARVWKYLNLPHDSHPSPLGQQHFADQLYGYLQENSLLK